MQLARRKDWCMLALMTTLLATSGCGDDSPDPNDGGGGGGGGGTTGLTVSAATPSNGDGTLTGITVTVDSNSAVVQGDAVYVVITGSVGSVQHQIAVYVLKSDESLPNIEHTWGSDLASPEGFTICDAGGVVGSACSASQVSADLAAGTLTFNGLVLTAATGDGDTSTIDGEVSW